MKTIYLSPHLDDAVLSCGGLIYDQVNAGMDVEVFTFMCAIPRETSSEKYTIRMKEDKEALKILGAKPIHYCFLDGLDRKDFEGNKLYSTVFSTVHPEDRTSLAITHLLKMQLESDDILMCPLAVGSHVDHVIIRKAGEDLGISLTYFVDFPYVEYLPDALDPAVLGLTETTADITSEGLSHWIDAMRKYVSQDLYPTPEITAQKIKEYWAKNKGVSLWRKET